MPDATKAPPRSELADFVWFLEHKLLPRRSCGLTVDSAVLAYREYQKAVRRMEQELEPALASLDAGKGTELDFQELHGRLERIL